MYGDNIDNPGRGELQHLLPIPNALVGITVLQGNAGSKTLHPHNPSVLNWRCQLMQVDLYNGRKTVVVVVACFE